MEQKRILGNAKCSKTLIRDTEVKIDRSKKVVVKHTEVPDTSKCASKSILKNSGNLEGKFSQSSSSVLGPSNTKIKEVIILLLSYHITMHFFVTINSRPQS